MANPKHLSARLLPHNVYFRQECEEIRASVGVRSEGLGVEEALSLLSEVEKYANATSATVELDFSGQEIRLAVTDDGRGFSPAKNISHLLRAGKLGLLGMKERAELVGGSFELRSDPGRGTQVVARVPQGGEPSA
jgi:signal transduction histidine kinase